MSSDPPSQKSVLPSKQKQKQTPFSRGFQADFNHVIVEMIARPKIEGSPHIGLSNRIGFTFILLLLMNWACRNVWACLLAVTRQQPAHLSKLKGRPTLFYRPKSSIVNKLKVNFKAMWAFSDLVISKVKDNVFPLCNPGFSGSGIGIV